MKLTEGFSVINFNPLGNPPGAGTWPIRRSNYDLPRFRSWRRIVCVLGISALSFAFGVHRLGHAQETIHGDWRVRILHGDGMRHCYAETGPLTGDANAELGDVRLQATRLSLVADDFFRLSEPPPEAAGIDAVAVGETTFPLEDFVDHGAFGDSLPVLGAEIAEGLRSGEAAGYLAMLLDDQGERRVTYSLRGFGAAYDALAGACEDDAPRPPIAPVTISELAFSAAEESCFTLPDPMRDMVGNNRDFELRYRESARRGGDICLEFAMEAPFRETGRSERIDVRVAVNPDALGFDWTIDLDSLAQQPTPPWFRLIRWYDFYSGETRVGDVGGYNVAAHQPGPQMCHDETAGKVNLIFRTASGPRYEERLRGSFDASGRLVWESMGAVAATRESAIRDCANGTNVWAWNGSFRPCACGRAVASNTYAQHLRTLLSDVETASASAGVTPQEFAALIDRVDRLQPFLEWDTQTSLVAETLESADYSLAIVRHDSDRYYWGSFQYVFGRRAGGDEPWKALFDAPASGMARFPMNVHELLDGGLLDVDMCVGDDCTWLHQRERLRLPIGQLLGDEFDAGNPSAQFEALDQMLVLEVGHGLNIPDAFWFRGAEAAFDAGFVDLAMDLVVRYMETAAQDAEHYRAARELYDAADPARAAADAEALAMAVAAVTPEMVVIPPGSFLMGCVSGRGCNEYMFPIHAVTILQAFEVSKYEVTFAQWDACVLDGGCDGYRPNDEFWGRGTRPVVNVSWDDAQAYVSWLSSRTGEDFRLLSEAEWEYAARAGASTVYSWGNELGTNRANCDGCGSQWEGDATTAPVGSFEPNAFGLFDMHGNVAEWVQDCWNERYEGAPTDGSPWLSGICSWRVLRGGSWFNDPKDLRSALRDETTARARGSNVGFRVARTLDH